MKKKNNRYTTIYPNAVRLRIRNRLAYLSAKRSRVYLILDNRRWVRSVRRKRGQSWR